MIDAGSSRSNVYLYEWPGAKENETGIVTETLNCKVDGESHIRKRGNYILTKLDETENVCVCVCLCGVGGKFLLVNSF